MKKLLAVLMLLSGCSCATLPKGQFKATIADESQDTAQAFACVEDPEEKGALLCVDIEALLLALEARRAEEAQPRGYLDL